MIFGSGRGGARGIDKNNYDGFIHPCNVKYAEVDEIVCKKFYQTILMNSMTI